MAFSVSRAHSRILIFVCVWSRAWWGYILGYVSFALFNLYLWGFFCIRTLNVSRLSPGAWLLLLLWLLWVYVNKL